MHFAKYSLTHSAQQQCILFSAPVIASFVLKSILVNMSSENLQAGLSPPKSPSWASWLVLGPRRSKRNSEGPATNIELYTNEFLSGLLSPEEGMARPKHPFKAELIAKVSSVKESYLDSLKCEMKNTRNSNERTNERLANELEESLRKNIDAYIRDIETRVMALVKLKAAEVFPQGHADVGIALPAVSREALEKAIRVKRVDVEESLRKTVSHIHPSWYQSAYLPELDNDLDNWAQDVREASKEIASQWFKWTAIGLAIMLPLLLSMVLFSGRTCKGGYYYSGSGSYTDIQDIFTSEPRCLPCPPGTYSHKGSTRCSPCDPGSYSSASKSLFCHLCPEGTTSGQQGATTCDCLNGYKKLSKMKSKPTRGDTNEHKGSAAGEDGDSASVDTAAPEMCYPANSKFT